MNKNIITKVEAAALEILKKEMPSELTFHNLEHTQMVVNACQEIGKHIQISAEDHEVTCIAAWFHDTGHAIRYTGHEDESKNIASQFLKKLQYDPEKTRQILNCIQVTRLGEIPRHITEKVLCDADFYHLACKRYFEYLSQLRKEWELVFNTKVSDEEWYSENLKFLRHHRFYTAYGQNVLEKLKQKNLKKNIEIFVKT